MAKIGISMGDPAGIGYEIVAKALLTGAFRMGDMVLVGNREIFLRTAARYSLDSAALESAEFVDIPSDDFSFESMKFGVPQRETGLIGVRSIEAAARLAQENVIDGICTGPMDRNGFALGGSAFSDHTGLLTAFTSSSDVTTVYELRKLRTMLMTRHLPLVDALKLVTRENVERHIMLCDRALRLLGSDNMRIAVAALNPHGGEGGLLGNTEINEIVPAISESSSRFDVVGPVPADAVYHRALNGEYGIVLSLFHDQARIALKTFDFYRTVDLNIGLPFLRASADHGPGFERAGKGTGVETNLVEAILKTIEYAPAYRKMWGRIGRGPFT